MPAADLSASARILSNSLTGRLVMPHDLDYETLRRVWNHDVDERPAMIVLCLVEDDIRRALEFARRRNLPLAIRGGGHSFAGHGVCDGGVVINLSRMKRLRIDPHRRRVILQAGVLGGELDQVTQAFALAVPLGSCPSVGVAGYATGGGEGSLTPRFGFGCDSLRAARLVAADSRLLTIDRENNPELLWAIRGGGGNFGIVTSLEMDLHPIDNVLAGHLRYPISRTTEVLRFIGDFTAAVPDELYLIVTVLPQPGDRMLDVGVVWSGAPDQGERVLEPLRGFIPAAQDSIKRKRYIEEQQSGSDSPSEGDWSSYRRAGHIRKLTPEVVEVIAQHAHHGPTEYCGVSMIYWHGPWVEQPHDTAFAFRRAGFEYWVHAYWQEPAKRDTSRQWVDEFYAALQPFSSKAVYVNNLGEEGPGRVEDAYSNNYNRLAGIKQKYDPENIFRLNQNIIPSGDR